MSSWTSGVGDLPARPSDVTGIITVFAENAYDGNGSKRFVLIEISKGQKKSEECQRALEAERSKIGKLEGC